MCQHPPPRAASSPRGTDPGAARSAASPLRRRRRGQLTLDGAAFPRRGRRRGGGGGGGRWRRRPGLTGAAERPPPPHPHARHHPRPRLRLSVAPTAQCPGAACLHRPRRHRRPPARLSTRTAAARSASGPRVTRSARVAARGAVRRPHPRVVQRQCGHARGRRQVGGGAQRRAARRDCRTTRRGRSCGCSAGSAPARGEQQPSPPRRSPARAAPPRPRLARARPGSPTRGAARLLQREVAAAAPGVGAPPAPLRPRAPPLGLP